MPKHVSIAEDARRSAAPALYECPSCHELKGLTELTLRRGRKKWWGRCLGCESEYVKNWYRKLDRREHLLRTAKRNAKVEGVPFDLVVADIVIPGACPVLGIPIIQTWPRPRDNAPSLDRIEAGGGYVRSNIVVISWRANRLKGEASLAELEAIARFYRNLGEAA